MSHGKLHAQLVQHVGQDHRIEAAADGYQQLIGGGEEGVFLNIGLNSVEHEVEKQLASSCWLFAWVREH
ncbi:hypothetical protein [Hymenobacter sp. 5516J-16]|uniref:hypothetical protein n=1 Tax=Hymenobacter sp. 5516J-16 TaxID=2932253 RepID=UPI0039783D24